MLTSKQQKLIRKYCLLPEFAHPTVWMGFLSAAIAVVLIMIDNVFLYNSTSAWIIGAEIFLPIVFYLGVVIYAVFSVIFGIRSKKWKELVQEVAVRTNFQPYTVEKFDEKINKYVPAGSMTYEESVETLSRHPSQVAERIHLELPSVKNLKRLILILPLVLQVVCFIPQFVHSYHAMEARTETAAAVLEQLDTTFSANGLKTSYDDPNEEYRSIGYEFRAYLPETEDYKSIYLSINVAEDGQIHNTWYFCDVNLNRTKEENLAMAAQSFEQLHALLMDSGVTFSTDAHTEVYALPDAFRTAFSEGSYTEEISLRNKDYDDTNVYYSYRAPSENPSVPYNTPEIYVMISTKSASR